jgi:hypothetical protein
MMQTFKSYISGGATSRKSVQLAFDLLMRGIDPEKFILDFTEENCPHIFTELILETGAPGGPVDDPATPDAAAPTASGGTNKTISKATGEFNKMMGGFKQASDEMGITGLLGKIASWFGGGGPQKQFDKAMEALGKVRSAFHVKPSDEIKNSDKRFADYDKFLAGLDEAIKTLGGFKQAPAMLAAIEQLQKNPEKFVLDDAGAADIGAKLKTEIEPAAEPEKKADGSGGAADATPAHPDPDTYGTHNQAEVDAAIQKAVTGAADHDPEIKKILDDPANNSGSPTDPMMKGMNDQKKKQAVAKYMGEKARKEASTDRDHYHRRGNVFSEALVLAGIPTRRRKK